MWVKFTELKKRMLTIFQANVIKLFIYHMQVNL